MEKGTVPGRSRTFFMQKKGRTGECPWGGELGQTPALRYLIYIQDPDLQMNFLFFFANPDHFSEVILVKVNAQAKKSEACVSSDKKKRRDLIHLDVL